MNGHLLTGFVRNLVCIVAVPLLVSARRSAAQSQPPTIPTVVAQAMTFEPELFGRPQFFDGRTPPDWPVTLTPPAAKVLGGGIIGDSAMFRMRVAVFEFAAQSNPRAVLEAAIARAGYVQPASEPLRPPSGGFVETRGPKPGGKLCNGSTFAMFSAVDSVRAPLVFAVYLVDGEAGRQYCDRREMDATMRRFPVTVPPLSPPAGVKSLGGGSGWSGSTGQMRSTLRTTMSADSVLAHYSAQLVSGGWKTEGRPANASGIGVQRFSFREGQDPWTSALVVISLGDRCEILLELVRNQ